MSTTPLAGQVVLITGASGGLGGALALACAHAGAQVVASGRNLRRLQALHARAQAQGCWIQLYPLDLEGAGPEELAQMVLAVTGEHGRLDALVHCAADFPGLTPLAVADPAAVARALHVNLTARIWLSQAALPALGASGGRLVLVADGAECGQQPYWGGYGLAQAGQHALAAMFQAELAGAGVQVLCWQPPPMPTALRARAWSHETGHVDRPEVVAQALLAVLAGGGESGAGGLTQASGAAETVRA